jgi:hypothetical protein
MDARDRVRAACLQWRRRSLDSSLIAFATAMVRHRCGGLGVFSRATAYSAALGRASCRAAPENGRTPPFWEEAACCA